MRIFRQRHGVAVGAGPQLIRECADRRDRTVEHHLNRIFNEGIFERDGLSNKRAVLLPVTVAVGMFPIHRFEHELPLAIAVEDQRGGVPEGARRGQHGPGDVAIQKSARIGLAVAAALNRAVTDDQRHCRRQGIGDGPGEWIAAAGDERHVNARRDGFKNGVTIVVREVSVAVEQGTVDVDANQPDHAKSVIP